MTSNFCINIPGKIIINGGYLVLNNHECISIVPSPSTTIKAFFTPSSNPKITISTNFSDSTTLIYKNKEYVQENNNYKNMQYFMDIVNSFYNYTNYKLESSLDIHFDFADVLYSRKADNMSDSVKTGLGSSCAILIGIVNVLLVNKIDMKTFIEICLNINQQLSPNSSGCDIVSCIVGSCIYKKYDYQNLKLPKDWKLLLGSFNRSTNTRSMIDRNFDDKKWKELATINSNIIECYRTSRYANLKKYYSEYLKCLKKIDTNILPDLQYEILTRSFNFDIIGCGASGSGGEDCVWCLVTEENLDGVKSFWNEKFSFVIVIEDLNGKSELNNII